MCMHANINVKTHITSRLTSAGADSSAKSASTPAKQVVKTDTPGSVEDLR